MNVEQIFNNCAKQHMINWNLAEFKKSHARLYKVILEALIIIANGKKSKIPFKYAALGVTDYKKNDLFEGDVIEWPDADEIGVIGYEKNGQQFRVQFDPKTHIPSCHIGLQMGRRGRAVKIGSIYDLTKFDELRKWRKI